MTTQAPQLIPPSPETKSCRYCQSQIPADATVCRYCQRDVRERAAFRWYDLILLVISVAIPFIGVPWGLFLLIDFRTRKKGMIVLSAVGIAFCVYLYRVFAQGG